MNPVEFTDVVRRAEDVQSASLEESDAPPQPAPGKRRDARLRYALLIGIALLSAWLALTIRNSYSEIDAELEMIRAKIALPTH